MAFVGIVLVALAVALALIAWGLPRRDRSLRKLVAGRAPGSGLLAGKHRRPRPIPSSPFEIDERPTLAHMERVPMWPNKYARPIDLSATQATDERNGRQPDKRQQ